MGSWYNRMRARASCAQLRHLVDQQLVQQLEQSLSSDVIVLHANIMRAVKARQSVGERWKPNCDSGIIEAEHADEVAEVKLDEAKAAKRVVFVP